MRVSYSLLNHSSRIVLFTRERCSLCDVAKGVVKSVASTRHFDYQEIDVMRKGQEEWRRLYQYETPVVHVQRVTHIYAKPDIVTEIGKLYHRMGMSPIFS